MQGRNSGKTGNMTFMNMNNNKTFSVGVIISTYNNPQWLEKTLWGYLAQTVKPDEIIIADDGSTDKTKALLLKYQDRLPIKHVWHEDNGFRKTEILNKAILASTADYLIFTDQDVIPRADFVETHCQFAEQGYFLSGGAVMLPAEVSQHLTQEDIISQTAFSIDWLCKNGVKRSWKLMKLCKNKTITRLLNSLTTAKASWNGNNASTWRNLILKANGFDQRMKYGGEDREFGERLFNAGIRSKQLRYSLPLLHLYHTRPYRNKEDWDANQVIRRQTKENKSTTTPFGINQTL